MPTETLRAEPDSSTHRPNNKKRKKKRHKERRKSSKKHKRSESNSVSTDSGSQSNEEEILSSDIEDDEDILELIRTEGLSDFQFDIKPLQDYLPDSKALYKEVFKIINKKEFKQMLPENLKKYDPREVRRWCFNEMEGISQKRLKAILLGATMTSSSSESDGIPSDSEKQQVGSSLNYDVEQGININLDSGINFDSKGQVVQDLSILAELSKSPNETEIDELLVGEEKTAGESSGGTSQSIQGTASKTQSSTEINPHPDLLELELRARALQSFLKYQEKRQKEVIDQEKATSSGSS